MLDQSFYITHNATWCNSSDSRQLLLEACCPLIIPHTLWSTFHLTGSVCSLFCCSHEAEQQVLSETPTQSFALADRLLGDCCRVCAIKAEALASDEALQLWASVSAGSFSLLWCRTFLKPRLLSETRKHPSRKGCFLPLTSCKELLH